MKRICILCLLAALLLGACGLADAPYMEPVRTYWRYGLPTLQPLPSQNRS